MLSESDTEELPIPLPSEAVPSPSSTSCTVKDPLSDSSSSSSDEDDNYAKVKEDPDDPDIKSEWSSSEDEELLSPRRSSRITRSSFKSNDNKSSIKNPTTSPNKVKPCPLSKKTSNAKKEVQTAEEKQLKKHAKSKYQSLTEEQKRRQNERRRERYRQKKEAETEEERVEKERIQKERRRERYQQKKKTETEEERLARLEEKKRRQNERRRERYQQKKETETEEEFSARLAKKRQLARERYHQRKQMETEEERLARRENSNWNSLPEEEKIRIKLLARERLIKQKEGKAEEERVEGLNSETPETEEERLIRLEERRIRNHEAAKERYHRIIETETEEERVIRLEKAKRQMELRREKETNDERFGRLTKRKKREIPVETEEDLIIHEAKKRRRRELRRKNYLEKKKKMNSEEFLQKRREQCQRATLRRLEKIANMTEEELAEWKQAERTKAYFRRKSLPPETYAKRLARNKELKRRLMQDPVYRAKINKQAREHYKAHKPVQKRMIRLRETDPEKYRAITFYCLKWQRKKTLLKRLNKTVDQLTEADWAWINRPPESTKKEKDNDHSEEAQKKRKEKQIHSERLRESWRISKLLRKRILKKLKLRELFKAGKKFEDHMSPEERKKFNQTKNILEAKRKLRRKLEEEGLPPEVIAERVKQINEDSIKNIRSRRPRKKKEITEKDTEMTAEEMEYLRGAVLFKDPLVTAFLDEMGIVPQRQETAIVDRISRADLKVAHRKKQRERLPVDPIGESSNSHFSANSVQNNSETFETVFTIHTYGPPQCSKFESGTCKKEDNQESNFIVPDELEQLPDEYQPPPSPCESSSSFVSLPPPNSPPASSPASPLGDVDQENDESSSSMAEMNSSFVISTEIHTSSSSSSIPPYAEQQYMEDSAEISAPTEPKLVSVSSYVPASSRPTNTVPFNMEYQNYQTETAPLATTFSSAYQPNYTPVIHQEPAQGGKVEVVFHNTDQTSVVSLAPLILRNEAKHQAYSKEHSSNIPPVLSTPLTSTKSPIISRRIGRPPKSENYKRGQPGRNIKTGGYVQCKSCHERYSVGALPQHMETRHNPHYRKGRCVLCDIPIRAGKEWQKHYHSQHKKESDLKLSIHNPAPLEQRTRNYNCDTNTSTSPSDSAPSSRPPWEDLIPCQECGKKIRRRTYFMHHVLCHNSQYKNKSCLPCNQKFDRPFDYYRHFNTAHPIEAERLKLTTNQQHLTYKPPVFKSTARKQNSALLPFICPTCGAGFKHKHGLQNHEYSQHGEGSKPENHFMCHLCPGKIIKNKQFFLKHIKKYHPEEDIMGIIGPREKCPLCSVHVEKKELPAHVSTSHPESYFTCRFCAGLRFSKLSITFHENTCTKASDKQLIALREELRANGELPSTEYLKINCQLCSTTTCMSNLTFHYRNRHKLVEKEKKKCEICERQYGPRVRHLYVIHMESVHKWRVEDAVETCRKPLGGMPLGESEDESDEEIKVKTEPSNPEIIKMKKIKCEICLNSFSIVRINSHFLKVHKVKEEKVFPCKVSGCKQPEFLTRGGIASHLMSKHGWGMEEAIDSVKLINVKDRTVVEKLIEEARKEVESEEKTPRRGRSAKAKGEGNKQKFQPKRRSTRRIKHRKISSQDTDATESDSSDGDHLNNPVKVSILTEDEDEETKALLLKFNIKPCFVSIKKTL